MTTYKEARGRTVKDVSADGELILVGWGSDTNWSLEVLGSKNANVLGQLEGAPGRKVSDVPFRGFLAGSNYVFVKDFVFNGGSSTGQYRLWEFRKDRAVACGSGKTDPPSEQRTVVGVSHVRLAFSPGVCVVSAIPEISGLVSAVSPDGHQYLAGPYGTLGSYKQIEVRRAADFEIAGRIDAGNDRFFENDLNQPPRYTPDGKFIVAIVQENHDARRWYLNIYETATLRLIDEIDITEWNPRKDRITQSEDSLTVPPHFGPTIVISPDRRLAAVGTYEHSFRLFDLQSKRELAHSTLARPPFFFTPDGATLITDHAAGVRIWNLDKIP